MDSPRGQPKVAYALSTLHGAAMKNTEWIQMTMLYINQHVLLIITIIWVV